MAMSLYLTSISQKKPNFSKKMTKFVWSMKDVKTSLLKLQKGNWKSIPGGNSYQNKTALPAFICGCEKYYAISYIKLTKSQKEISFGFHLPKNEQNSCPSTFHVELAVSWLTVFSFVFFEDATKLKLPPDIYPPLFFYWLIGHPSKYHWTQS